jgi:hypothetical protein
MVTIEATIVRTAALLINVLGVGIGDGLAAFTLVEHDDRWVVRQYQVPYDDRGEKQLNQGRGISSTNQFPDYPTIQLPN